MLATGNKKRKIIQITDRKQKPFGRSFPPLELLRRINLLQIGCGMLI